MSASKRAVAMAIVVAGIGFWLATTAAQQPGPPNLHRMVVSDLTAPAIDRGLRENDPPRAPRKTGDRIVSAAGDTAYLGSSVIVKFRVGTTLAAQRAMLALIDGQPTPSLPYANFDIVALDAGADPEATARRLNAQPDVEYAQARYVVRPMFAPNDPLYARQWNFPAIDMERAWDINPGATPAITVAVLDSGVAYRSGMLRFNTVPFLVGSTLFPSLGLVDVPFAAAPDLGGADRFVAPRDFIWDDNDPVDLDGHGTHVTGTIGQLTNNGLGGAGMAFNVRIMPVKVIDGDWDLIFNSPFTGTDDLVARGVRYAVDNGARVINMSIGRTSGGPAPVVQSAIAYAVSRGAFVAVAGGNEFREGNPAQRLAEFAPSIDGMVAIGAIGRERERAGYSSTGAFIELAAPGGDIARSGVASGVLQQTLDFDLTETYLSGPSAYRAPRFDSFAFEFLQGTSMATPHVSGFAALLMQQGITSPAAVEAAMKRFATDLGASGRDNEYGDGLINPRAALRGLGLAR